MIVSILRPSIYTCMRRKKASVIPDIIFVMLKGKKKSMEDRKTCSYSDSLIVWFLKLCHNHFSIEINVLYVSKTFLRMNSYERSRLNSNVFFLWKIESPII